MRCARTLGLALAVTMCACAGRQQARNVDRARLAVAREMVERQAWGDAFEALKRYHAEAPACAESLTLRGVALREQGLNDEAESDLERAVALDHRFAPAHAALAILLDLEGRFSEAEPHHRRAIELEPKNARYLNDLGFAEFSRGRVDQAVAAYRAALQIDPTLRRARTNLGFALARKGDFTRAAQQFDLAEPPPAAKNNLGVAYELAGQLGAAFDAYLAAVRFDPTFDRARANLINVARASGRALPADLAPAQGGG